MRINDHVRPVPRICISIVLFTWTVSVFFPGSYSIDSWHQYHQAAHNSYNDWFGPALSFLWRITMQITGNFSGIYLLQMMGYWTFVTLWLWNTRITSPGFWISILAALFFCFIPQYIMRDVLLVVCWGIAALLLLRSDKGSHPKVVLFAVFLLLMYGLWLRPNAVIALVPLAWAATGNVRAGRWKRLLLSAGICGLLFIFQNLLTYQVFHASKGYGVYKLKLLDITGISKLSGRNYVPYCIRSYKHFNERKLFSTYTPASFDDIYWPKDGTEAIIPAPDAALNDCVNKAWQRAISTHPFLYLQNRANGFLYYLRIRKRFADDAYWNVAIWIDPSNPLQLKQESNAVRDRFALVYNKLNGTFFYDPWFWLLLNLGAFSLFVYRARNTRVRYWQTHACIQLSGVLYMLSQFPVYQHDRDFRYTYWNVFVALVAIAAFPKKEQEDTPGKCAP